MKPRFYLQTAVCAAVVWAAGVAFSPLPAAAESRHAPILAASSDAAPYQTAEGAVSLQDLRNSAEKAGKRAMFSLIATTSVFSLLTLGVLGLVVYRARLHEPKLMSHTEARNLKTLKNSIDAQPARILIHTSDVYDVASRGRDGQAVKFERNRNWHYDKTEPLSSFPPPAQARPRTIPSKPKRVPLRPVPPKTSVNPASSPASRTARV